MTNEQTGDPKCWLCGAVKKPSKTYGPNICDACLPDYKKRTFVFVRPTQQEMEEIVREKRSLKPDCSDEASLRSAAT